MTLLFFLLACRSGQVEADAPVEPVPVHATWAALDLPTDRGVVVFSDAEMLTLYSDGGDPAALGAAMVEALQAAGFTVQSDTSAGELVSVSLGRDEVNIALSAMASSATTTVTLTRFAAEASP